MKTQKSVALLILFFSGVDMFGAQIKPSGTARMPKMSKQSVARIDESAECNCRPKPKPGAKDMGSMEPVEHAADCACNRPKPKPQPRTVEKVDQAAECNCRPKPKPGAKDMGSMEPVEHASDCACNRPKPKPQPRTSVEPVSESVDCGCNKPKQCSSCSKPCCNKDMPMVDESADCGCSKPKPCSSCSKPCCNKDMPMVDESADCKDCTVIKPKPAGNKVTVRFRTRKPGAEAATQPGVSVSRKK